MNDRKQIGISNIHRISFDKFEKHFSFIVNEKIYKINAFVANIISPNVLKMFEDIVNFSNSSKF